MLDLVRLRVAQIPKSVMLVGLVIAPRSRGQKVPVREHVLSLALYLRV